jgi:2-polyprenyl-3-methyl-5-hydroxy-6-metoxy-1,4-benzoquinol methylase
LNWKNFWDKKATHLDENQQVARIINGAPFSEELLDKISIKISDQLELSQEDTLLDICCGNGLLTHRLLSKVKETVGVDFSSKLIAEAQAKSSDNIRFINGDAQSFSLDEKFSKVLIYFSFQYFEDYSSGMQVIKNALLHSRPNTKILIGDIPDKTRMFHYYNTPKRLWQLIKQTMLGKNDMGKFWSPKELESICKKLGVKGVAIAQEEWQPYSHYRFDFLIER